MTALLAAGADLDLRNRDGRTAASIAAARGHTLVVQLLVGCGANTALRNHENNTLAEVAEAKSHTASAAHAT